MLVLQIGNVHSRLIGEIPDPLWASICEHLSYEIENLDKIKLAYQKKPIHSQRDFLEQKRILAWDGRKILITEIQKRFSTGLLPRLISVLTKLNTPFEIVDKRIRLNKICENPMKSDVILRPYQKDAVVTAIESELGTIRIPTGGGKTVVGCQIISELSRRSLFIVTRRDLLYQAIESFKKMLVYGDFAVGQIGDGIYTPNFVTVATVQTLCAAFGMTADVDEEESSKENISGATAHREMIEDVLKSAEVVLFDEVQHVAAKTCFDVMERCSYAMWRIGLSATDWREDGADLLIEAATGPRCVNIDMSTLIAQGYLVPPIITTHQMAEHVDGWSYQGKERWAEVYKHFYSQNLAFHRQTADIASRWICEGRSILTLVTTIEHGKNLEKICTEKGIDGVFISGAFSSKKRSKIFEDVRTGRLCHLIATSIADEGLDLPALDALILAGGGKSSIKTYQRIGRILRPSPGKTSGYVADFVSPDHHWLRAQYEKRKDIYQQEKAFLLK